MNAMERMQRAVFHFTNAIIAVPQPKMLLASMCVAMPELEPLLVHEMPRAVIRKALTEEVRQLEGTKQEMIKDAGKKQIDQPPRIIDGDAVD